MRSGCAAASPASDSLTTCAGSLRNLRIFLVSIAIRLLSLVRGGGAGRRLFVRDGFLDRLLDVARVGQIVVSERGQGRSNEPGDEVDRNVLRPEGGAAGDRLHELRTEGARRVEGRAGDWAEDQDDADHSAANHETRELRRRAAVDDAKDGEEQQAGACRL